jgi:hypothetical protein
MKNNRGKLSTYRAEFKGCGKIKKKSDLLSAIARGEKAVFEGRVFSELEAETKMSKWLK